MIELDERLRAELQELREQEVDLGVHLEAVINLGRRRRGRRQLRGAISLVAAAAAIAVIALPLASSLAGTGRSVPAAPGPGPASAAANTTQSATFDLSGYGLGDDYAAVEVEARRTGPSVAATISQFNQAGMMLAQFTGPLTNPDEAAALSVAGRVEIGLLNGVARWVAPRGSTPGVQLLHKELAGPMATVYVMVFPEKVTTSSYPDVFWQDGSGTVRAGVARVVPSTEVDAAGRTGTVYLDTDLDVFGFVQSDGNSWSFAASEADQRTRCYFAGEETAGGWDSLVLCLLPPGAQDPEPELVDATKVAATEVGGRKVLVMPGSADSLKGIVKSVTYTNADGESVTDPG